MRHILWWIFYGALVIGGVLMYALNIITIGKSDSASSRVHGHITLLAKTTCLCLCLIFGVLYIQRARKRDTGAADEMSSAVRPDNASTAAIVPSGPFAPSDSSSVPTMSQALLAPALRSPPFTLYMDNLMASLPLDSSRIRKQVCLFCKIVLFEFFFFFLFTELYSVLFRSGADVWVGVQRSSC
jgi:hypothetical protein